MRKVKLLAIAAAAASLIGASTATSLADTLPVPPSKGLGADLNTVKGTNSAIQDWEQLTGETSPIIENTLTFSTTPDEAGFFANVKAENATPFLGINCDTTCESNLNTYIAPGMTEADAFAWAIKQQLRSAHLSSIYMTVDAENNNLKGQEISDPSTFRAAWNTIFHSLLTQNVPVTRIYQVTADYSSEYSSYQIFDAQVLPSILAIDIFGPDGQTLTSTMPCPDTHVPNCARTAVLAAEALGFNSDQIIFGSTAVSESDKSTLKDPQQNWCAAWANLQTFSVNYGLRGFIWFDINNMNGNFMLKQYCAP